MRNAVSNTPTPERKGEHQTQRVDAEGGFEAGIEADLFDIVAFGGEGQMTFEIRPRRSTRIRDPRGGAPLGSTSLAVRVEPVVHYAQASEKELMTQREEIRGYSNFDPAHGAEHGGACDDCARDAFRSWSLRGREAVLRLLGPRAIAESW